MRKLRIFQTTLVLAATLVSIPVAAEKNETVPTMPPSDNKTSFPTPAPTPNSTTVPTTAAPVPPPTMQPTKKYVPPVTAAPTAGEPEPDPPQHTSIGRMIARTVGWLIILALSVLCFGAIMSNRYRIYYALRGLWYAFLRLGCTRWIIRKVRYGNQGPSSNQSLNEIIFDQQDLNEGLLLNSNQ